MPNPASGAGDGPELRARNPSTVISSGFPILTGRCSEDRDKQQNSPDQVGDIAEAARLEAVAVDGQIFSAQRLGQEVRDDPSVPYAQSRTIGVEDADEMRPDSIIAVIRHGQRLGVPFGFVVDTSAGPPGSHCPNSPLAAGGSSGSP